MVIVSLLFTFLEHFKVVYPMYLCMYLLTSLIDMFIFMRLCHKMVFDYLLLPLYAILVPGLFW